MTEQCGTAQNLSSIVSGINPEVMSRLTVTITDMSPTTYVSQITQNELESSLYFSYSPEPTVTMFTPPLLSEYSSSGPLQTSDIITQTQHLL